MWTVIGDVDGLRHYHVGDEAMLEANLELLREICPGGRMAVVSNDPAFTSEEYGVEALARLGFDDLSSEAERDAMLASLSRPDLPGAEMPAALRGLTGSDGGLLISGGGSFSSARPGGIYERLALCRRAALGGQPIILSGQTVSSDLDPRHRAMTAEILRAAWWIGVRDPQSYAVCLELGVSPAALSYQIDDTAWYGPFPADDVDACADAGDVPWIGVTLHPFVDPSGADRLIDLIAGELHAIASHTGCRLVFTPHAAAAPALGAVWSDHDMGSALAHRLPDGVMEVRPLSRARDVARLTREARMVVSSRAHPIIFACGAGIPCLGIATDTATRIELQGALNHYDRPADVCSVAELRTGELLRRAMALWDGRAVIHDELTACHARNARAERWRRHRLAALIRDRRKVAAQTPTARLVVDLAVALRQAEVAAAETRAAGLVEAQAHADTLEYARDEAERSADSLRTEFDKVRLDNSHSKTTLMTDALAPDGEFDLVYADLEDLRFEVWKRGGMIKALHAQLVRYSARIEDLHVCTERLRCTEALLADAERRAAAPEARSEALTEHPVGNNQATPDDGIGTILHALYWGILQRDPDEDGLAHFTDLLANGRSVAEVADMMVASPEFATLHPI